MSGDHNMYTGDGSASEPRKELAMFVPLSDFRRVEERAQNAELQVEHWMNKANTYQDLMDATAQDADRAYELLRRCETEMRYAGWSKHVSDNPARKEVYDNVVNFLEDPPPKEADQRAWEWQNQHHIRRQFEDDDFQPGAI